MKKAAVLVAILVLAMPATGWCLSTTVDTFIENRMASDLHPVADAGKILDMTNKGVDGTYHLVKDPIDPMLSPVMKIKDETMKAAKTITNFTWDLATLKHFRGKKG